MGFAELRQRLGLLQPQRSLLCRAPAGQAVLHLRFVAFFRRGVEVRAQQRRGQILLADVMAGLHVGVEVAFAVVQIPHDACRRRAVLQVLGHLHLAFGFHLLVGFEAAAGRVRLGRGGQVERGLDCYCPGCQ